MNKLTDFINKIVSIALIFIICVITPLTYIYLSTYKANQRLVLNQAKYELDNLVNKDAITESDLDKVYRDLNTKGIIVDGEVEKYTKSSNGEYVMGDYASAYDEMYYETDGLKDVQYLSRYGCTNFDELKKKESRNYKFILQSGDIVKISVKEVVGSVSMKYIRNVLGINEERLEFSLASMVD